MQGRMSAPAAPDPVAAARALAPTIRAACDRIDAARRLPPDLVDALAGAGLFRLCVPRAVGGVEARVTTLIEAVEAVAEADGSAGWCVAIGATSGLLVGYFADDVAREVFHGPEVVLGGVFAPRGRALPESGGYRVSGRWPFASGCQHCTWLMGGCVVLDDGAPRLLPRGLPDSRLMLVPAAEAEIVDTWSVAGLRGTGSHDMVLGDAFVPAGRAVSLITDRPVQDGPLYLFPVFGLLAVAIAAVASGVARSAIATLIALAADKTPTTSRRRLADRPVVQMQVAQAEAGLRAARALLVETVGEAWEQAATEGAIGVALRARLRLASTHLTRAAAAAVDLMYEAGGGTSIYDTSVLQRQFRDVHTATQHAMVAPATLELVGRVLLGLETDTSML